jgi:predicted MFS family arabinose efflux permease
LSETVTARPGPSAGDAKKKRINWRIVRLGLAVFGLTLCSSVTVAVSPFINGALMDQRLFNGAPLNDLQAGMIRTAEILTFATLTIFISARIRLFEPRALGLFGVAMIFAGNLAAIPGTEVWDVVAARMCHAIGAASAMSAASAFIVLAPHPQRISGALVIPGLVFAMAAVIAAGQFATAGQSQLGAFGAVAGVALLAFVLVLAFAPKGRGHATDLPAFSSMLGALKSPYVIGCAVVFFGSTAVWQSFRMIGESHGFDPAGVAGVIIGVQALGMIFGTSMALVKADWVRPVAMTALVVYGVATTLTPLAPNATLFIAAYAALSCSYLCLMVMISAIGARIDRTGGLNAAGLGWQALINATAPYVGGAIVTYGGGYGALYIPCVVASLIAVPAFFLATRHLPPPLGAIEKA